MGEWIAVAPVKELQRRKKTQVQVGNDPVALFLVRDKVYALYDTCMHEQRSLSKGAILSGCVICPGHQWQFELETGLVEEEQRYQPTYDVKVDDGTVYVWSVPRVVESSGREPLTGVAP